MVKALGSQPRSLYGERRQGLATRGGQSSLGRELYATLEVPAHVVDVAGRGVRQPPPCLEAPSPEGARILRGSRGGAIDPLPRFLDLAKVQVTHRSSPCRKELKRVVTD